MNEKENMGHAYEKQFDINSNKFSIFWSHWSSLGTGLNSNVISTPLYDLNTYSKMTKTLESYGFTEEYELTWTKYGSTENILSECTQKWHKYSN